MKDKMKIDIRSLFMALFGIFLVGLGVALNSCAGLGNDSIGIVYDGLRSTLKLSSEQLGTASNFMNYGLIVLLLFVGRRYVNIGTLIYILPYGFFVNFGTWAYGMLIGSDSFLIRCLTGVAGCSLLYLGVAIFIATDIGLDPFTGLVMVLRDITKKEFRVVKVIFDFAMILLGTILGGKLGVVTFITAITAGPVIQFFTKKIQKHIGG